MIDQLRILRTYVRMMWLYRWMALGCAALICIGGWLFVLSMPNEYHVQTKVFIDTRSMLRPLLRGLAVNNNVVRDTALLMRRTLLTRPNIEEIVRRADLDLNAKTEREFDDLVEDISDRISVSGTRRDNTYDLKFVDQDPKVAKRVVDELLNTFLETALGDSRKDTAVTQKFLDEQIAEYERKLVEAEDRLKEFKRKNMGNMPKDGGTYYNRLQRAESTLSEAKLQMKEALRRRDELRRQLGGEEPVFGLVTQSSYSSPEVQKLQARIASNESRLDNLLLNYTEKHPDVIYLREQIADLEKDIEAEQQAAAGIGQAAPSASLNQNPVFQQLKLSLSRADSDVAALSERVKEYEKRVVELQDAVDTNLEVESELKRLDRDYGLNRKQYNELLERREKARMAQEAEQTQDTIQIKVLEPPKEPLSPAGPERLQLLSLVFAAALGASAALAFLVSQINPRIFTREELKNLTGLPILGTVSFVAGQMQATERKLEIAVFGAGLSVLAGCYVALLVATARYPQLHDKVYTILGL